MDGFLGTIMMCGFNFAPRNYAFCQGAALPIAQNTALYSLLGTEFGGDGRSTFNLPNLGGGLVPGGQGSFPGLSAKAVGEIHGRETCTLAVSHLPSHDHEIAEQIPGRTVDVRSEAALQANKSTPDAASPENNYCAPAQSGMSKLNSYATTPDTTMNSEAIDIQTTGSFNADNLQISFTGGGQPVSLIQPMLILNFVICTHGEYPARS
jgi:microcystin-dependent protein